PDGTPFSASGATTNAVYVAPAAGLSGAFGLAFDAGSSHPFVTGQGNQQTGAILFNGAVLQFQGPGGGSPGSATVLNNFAAIFNPQAVAFDSSGNLYVANGTGNMVEEFTAAGAYIQTYVLPGPLFNQIHGSGGL